MAKISIIFPHQLFKDNPAISKGRKVILVEETLYFNQYKFHKQKLNLHRASMKFYEKFLQEKGWIVEYVEAREKHADVRKLVDKLAGQNISEIHFTEVTDDWLNKRIKRSADKNGIKLTEYKSPMFLNSMKELKAYFGSSEKFLHARFYIEQRKKRNILLDGKDKLK